MQNLKEFVEGSESVEFTIYGNCEQKWRNLRIRIKGFQKFQIREGILIWLGIPFLVDNIWIYIRVSHLKKSISTVHAVLYCL